MKDGISSKLIFSINFDIQDFLATRSIILIIIRFFTMKHYIKE